MFYCEMTGLGSSAGRPIRRSGGPLRTALSWRADESRIGTWKRVRVRVRVRPCRVWQMKAG